MKNKFFPIIFTLILLLLIPACNFLGTDQVVSKTDSKLIPKLLSPKIGETISAKHLKFTWNALPEAEYYHLIAYNIKTNRMLINSQAITTNEYLVTGNLQLDDKNLSDWVWTVRAKIRQTWWDWPSPSRFNLTR